MPEQQPPAVQEQSAGGQGSAGQQPQVVAKPDPTTHVGGGLAEVPDPGSKSPEPTGGHGGQYRPSGNAPGIKHDIPTNGSNYEKKADWEKSRRDHCREALGQGHDNCVTFNYQWFIEAESGDLDLTQPIHDPTSNYFNKTNYNYCRVGDINPPSDDEGLVPIGTRITIKIGCYPAAQSTGESQTGGGQSQTGTQNGSNTSEQQPAKKKGKHGTESRSGK